MMPLMANDYSCKQHFKIHPVGNEFGLQIILKSNQYYKGAIDGQIGNISKNAIKSFQNTVGLDADGIIGKDTCRELLTIVPKENFKNSEVIIDESLKEVQTKLKELGLYLGDIDGIKGSNTTNAMR